MVVWWKEPKVEKSCKCEGTGCKCSTGKSPMKQFPRTAAMYKNDAGTSFALSYVAAEIGRHFGHMFGAFSIGEEEGVLVIHTGMVRDAHIESLIKESCKQPCEGDCETKCNASISHRSTREVAGL